MNKMTQCAAILAAAMMAVFTGGCVAGGPGPGYPVGVGYANYGPYDGPYYGGYGPYYGNDLIVGGVYGHSGYYGGHHFYGGRYQGRNPGGFAHSGGGFHGAPTAQAAGGGFSGGHAGGGGGRR